MIGRPVLAVTFLALSASSVMGQSSAQDQNPFDFLHRDPSFESFREHAIQLIKERRYEEAALEIDRAANYAEDTFGPETEAAVNTALVLGRLCLQYPDLRCAAKLFHHALTVNEKIEGPDTVKDAVILRFLGDLEPEFSTAEAAYLRALQIVERAEGAETAGSLDLLVRLGRRYAARGDYAKGEQAYRRAIAIGEKLEKPDMRTATAITGLAAIFEKQGEYSKAEPLFLLGVPMFESIAGPDHLGTADPIFDFAENSLLSKTNLTSV